MVPPQLREDFLMDNLLSSKGQISNRLYPIMNRLIVGGGPLRTEKRLA